MDLIRTLAYAGLGLSAENNEKLKDKFNELVEAGKKADTEGKNYIGDFFKTVDSTKEDFEANFEKNKEKLMEQFPMLKELEERLNQTKEDVSTKFNSTKADLTEKAKTAQKDIKSKAEDISKKANETKEEVENKIKRATKK